MRCEFCICNEQFAMDCGCACHPWMSSQCQDGRHLICCEVVDRVAAVCSCPCHFRARREQLLELRQRAAN